MSHRLELLTAIAILGACTEHGGEASAEPPETPNEASATKAVVASAATPDDATEAVAEVEPPPAAPPTELFVAAEGRCRYMATSLVQGKAFVHYSGAPIVQLESDGTPTSATHDTKAAKRADDPPWDQHLPQIDRLAGRPDALYAEVLEHPREGLRAVYRRTPNAWERVDIFGKDAPVDRVYSWYDGSTLAFVAYGESSTAKFGVVRGKPKGPRFDRAMAKAGCSQIDVDQVLVLERGDVVATWTCENHDTFVTHWRKGDLAGNTKDLGGGGGTTYYDRREPRTIAADEADGYYVLVNDGDGKQRVWHGKDAQWTAFDVPKGAAVVQMEVDPKGRLWAAGKKLVRRDGDAWTEIAIPDGKPIVELAGARFGTPWVRNGVVDEYRGGGRLWRIADDKATEITIPQSAFFEDEKLKVTQMQFMGPDDVWADASFVVQRHGKGKAGRYYHSVLRSKPVVHPLRCGELVDGDEMKQAFVPWPTAAGGACKNRLALLVRRSSWDDGNDYAKFRKALAKVEGIAGVRFVELELGKEKFLGAITEDAALVATIQKKIKKLRPYTYPEVVCGDEAVLQKAGVVVHRELSFAAQ